MFWLLLRFEIKRRLFTLSSLIYGLLYGTIALLGGLAIGGAFSGVAMNFGLSSQLPVNSPVVLHCLIAMVSFFGLLIIAPIFAQSINQDFETAFSNLLFVTPVRKLTYFCVRYCASFVVVLVIFLSIGIGLWLVTLMPFIDESRVAENHLLFYLAPYFSVIIPNVFCFGSVFLFFIAIFKKMTPVYIANVIVFMGLMLSNVLLNDLDNHWISALCDPSGLNAMHSLIRYWSVLEQSAQTIPLEGYFYYNRLLWGLVGFVALSMAYYFFNPFALKQERRWINNDTSHKRQIFFSKCKINPSSARILWQLSLIELKTACSSAYLKILLLCGGLYICLASSEMGKIYGTELLPVTYQVLEIIGDAFALFALMITSCYAGELIWKDRETKVFELIDATPVSNCFLYLSKLLSLSLLQIVLLGITGIFCISVQIYKGYFHIEWGLYGKFLLIYTLPVWLLNGIFTLFAHIIARNKTAGHAIVIFYLLLVTWLPALGCDHHLYLIGTLPKSLYSDMNGFGASFPKFFAFSLYWGFFHLILIVFSVLLLQRGVSVPHRTWIRSCLNSICPIHRRILAVSVSSWIALGLFIYYNTNILNPYKTVAQQELERVNYERNYGAFEKIPHPDLTGVVLQVDLAPETQSMVAKGTFTYCNRSAQPMKMVLLNFFQDVKVHSIVWNRPVKLVKREPTVGIYEFDPPLQPTEQIELQFSVQVQPQGFKNGEFSTKIVENGTFFHSYDYFPTIGYQNIFELSDENARKKYGLGHKPVLANINDLEALQRTYISNEGTWIDFDAIISTSSDQIAIAPGHLEKEWEVNHRRYFHYKATRPILPLYAILSGRYAVTHDKWNEISIEVYHHPEHTANIARMIHSVQCSLDYYTTHFSRYQFEQLKIVEFPRYLSYAQSLPNIIPYSEAVGFIAYVNPDDPEEIDYPFYITAHEVAHQWWAHQVISGNVQGATMLSESLAQYSALMVMEKEFGPLQMKKFLKHEHDGYLHGRACETKKEHPLAYNEDQGYVHYQKGGIVFYALKDYLGEETVNRVLREYIQDVAFQNPPFTRSIDLVNRFKEAAPLDRKYLIEDLFETITLYDHHMESAYFQKSSNGKYEIEIASNHRKLRIDDFGRENEIPMKDPIDIGIFDESGTLRYLQKHLMASGHNVLKIEVDFSPSKAEIDPLNKLIDKTPDDNFVKASFLEMEGRLHQ